MTAINPAACCCAPLQLARRRHTALCFLITAAYRHPPPPTYSFSLSLSLRPLYPSLFSRQAVFFGVYILSSQGKYEPGFICHTRSAVCSNLTFDPFGSSTRANKAAQTASSTLP